VLVVCLQAPDTRGGVHIVEIGHLEIVWGVHVECKSSFLTVTLWIILPLWRDGRCPVLSLMSLDVDAVSPSHVTVTSF
jgi:hypothetical protein